MAAAPGQANGINTTDLHLVLVVHYLIVSLIEPLVGIRSQSWGHARDVPESVSSQVGAH